MLISLHVFDGDDIFFILPLHSSMVSIQANPELNHLTNNTELILNNKTKLCVNLFKK